MRERIGGVAFDQLIDEVSDLIFVLGPGFRICYLNQAVERTLGWSAKELLGKRGLRLVLPEDRPTFRQSLRERPLAPELSVQLRVRIRSGDYRLLRLRASLSWEEDGRFQQARVIAQDVTEQVALRHAHSSRATHFSALMDLFQQEVVDAPPMHLLQSLLDLAIETIPDAQRGTILLRGPSGFRFVASVGWPLEVLQRLDMPLDDEHNELLRRSGIKVIRLAYDPQQLLDLGEPTELIEQLRAIGTYDIRVSLRAPILLEGELYGYFNLDNMDRPAAFDDLAQEALILFAGQAAVSLKYQQMLDQLASASKESRRQATRQSLIARIATIINSTLDLEDVFATSLALISEAIDVQKAGIVLFDWKRRVGSLVAQW
nr:PAS domain S-box protein [Ardenticatenales bacterium]